VGLTFTSELAHSAFSTEGVMKANIRVQPLLLSL